VKWVLKKIHRSCWSLISQATPKPWHWTAVIDGTGLAGAAIGPLLTGYISAKKSWTAVFIMLMVAALVACMLMSRLVIAEVSAKLRPGGQLHQVTCLCVLHFAGRYLNASSFGRFRKNSSVLFHIYCWRIRSDCKI
jgi:MFS family permease